MHIHILYCHLFGNQFIFNLYFVSNCRHIFKYIYAKYIYRYYTSHRIQFAITYLLLTAWIVCKITHHSPSSQESSRRCPNGGKYPIAYTGLGRRIFQSHTTILRTEYHGKESFILCNLSYQTTFFTLYMNLIYIISQQAWQPVNIGGIF